MAPEPFRHKPLDQTVQSVRLIHLNPKLSDDGRIQCSMTQATTQARYVCLSYRWGETERSWRLRILMDGRPFFIQTNLLDFLHTMQSTAPRDDPIFDPNMGYWIDALSIDQENTLERNHQVSQMGAIYSHVEYVHIWLGSMVVTESMRMCGTHVHANDDQEISECLVERSSNLHHDRNQLNNDIFYNQYWTRTWIIQEIVLVQHVIVSLDRQRVTFSDLLGLFKCSLSSRTRTPIEKFQNIEASKGQPLIFLLSHFSEQNCTLVHDRIFSLLPLCSDGTDIPRDYNMPVEELAYHTLKNPWSPRLSICSALVAARSLNLFSHAKAYPHMSSRTCLDIEVTGLQLQNGRSSCTRNKLPVSMDNPLFDTAYNSDGWSLNITNNYVSCKSRILEIICRSFFGNMGFLAHLCNLNASSQTVALSAVLSAWMSSATNEQNQWYPITSLGNARIVDAINNVCIIRIPLRDVQQSFGTFTAPCEPIDGCAGRTAGIQRFNVVYC